MQLQPDTLLQGRYRVVRLIARGGMGAVYQALDERLGASVALKQTLMADPALRAAFEREARLLAGLQHPALPVVSDHFAEAGGQFLVMQFIPGDDLAAMLRARGAPFPPAQVLAWADEILDALDYLHGRRPPVVHRDIKPQNLKLAPHGGLVLLDFGLAKGLGGAAGPSPSLFGYTPQYAPIEQIQGSGTDPRSDLYSLAATLVELLGGAPPPDALARLSAIVAGLPDPLRPVLEIQPKMPPHAADAITRALALNAASRPPTAAAMRAALVQDTPATASTGPTVALAAFPPAPHQPPAAGPGGPQAPGPGAPSDQRPAPGGPAIEAATRGPAAPWPAATGPTIAAGQDPRQPAYGRGRAAHGRRPAPPLLTGGALLAALLLAAFLTFSSPAPAVVTPTLPPIVTAEAAPAGPGSSFADPVPYGRDGRYGPLTVRVLDSMRGREAWNAMHRANQFNDPPIDGAEYLLVRLALEASAPAPEPYIRLAGERGVLYAPAGVSPAPLDLPDGAFAAGQRVEAWLPYVVAEGEEDLVLHLAALASMPGLAPLHLAVDADARRAPDPALEQIVPDEVGVAHTDPAPLGTPAVAEDYVVTVLEARRGPAVLDELAARYAGVERPRAGYEYALVHLRVRYIGDGGVVGWAGVGPGNVGSVSASAADPEAEQIDHPAVYILPDALPELDFNLLPGGEAAGWTVVELPVGAVDMALVFSPGFDPSGLNTRYLALE